MTKFAPIRKSFKREEVVFWIYEDAAEQSLYVKAGMLGGFNLGEFDTWLISLEACQAKQELIERRQAAIEAENIHELRRHIEFLTIRSLFLRREDALLPLAKAADQRNKTQQKIAKLPRGKQAWLVVMQAAMKKSKRADADLKSFLQNVERNYVEDIRCKHTGGKYEFEITLPNNEVFLKKSSFSAIKTWWTNCD